MRIQDTRTVYFDMACTMKSNRCAAVFCIFQKIFSERFFFLFVLWTADSYRLIKMSRQKKNQMLYQTLIRHTAEFIEIQIFISFLLLRQAVIFHRYDANSISSIGIKTINKLEKYFFSIFGIFQVYLHASFIESYWFFLASKTFQLFFFCSIDVCFGIDYMVWRCGCESLLPFSWQMFHIKQQVTIYSSGKLIVNIERTQIGVLRIATIKIRSGRLGIHERIGETKQIEIPSHSRDVQSRRTASNKSNTREEK